VEDVSFGMIQVLKSVEQLIGSFFPDGRIEEACQSLDKCVILGENYVCKFCFVLE
jgi:hypothetical protein